MAINSDPSLVVFYDGPDIVVTNRYIETRDGLYPLPSLRNIHRLLDKSRRNPRWMELRADFAGRRITLFSSRNRAEFEKPCAGRSASGGGEPSATAVSRATRRTHGPDQVERVVARATIVMQILHDVPEETRLCFVQRKRVLAGRGFDKEDVGVSGCPNCRSSNVPPNPVLCCRSSGVTAMV